MGDGEFIGGGSVKWEVNNSDGDTGGGNKKQCKGRDNDPKGEDPFFVVYVDGNPQFTHPATKGHSIKVVWGPSSVTSALSTSTPAPRAARKKAGKSKASK